MLRHLISHGTSYHQLAGPGFISGTSRLQSKAPKAQRSPQAMITMFTAQLIQLIHLYTKNWEDKKVMRAKRTEILCYYGFN